MTVKGYAMAEKFVFNRALSIVALFFLLATALSCAPIDRTWESRTADLPETELTTQFGKVRGFLKEDVLTWAGIPYGKTPEGSLRWRAPQDPTPWTDICEADKERIAIQLTRGNVIGGEDSLNLTVHRPNTKESNLPILFYIHGGNNQTGESSEIDSPILVTRLNAVVVTVNHRLDLLGFNNLPALKTGDSLEDSGNFALLDINKALDWTIANARHFGGNPRNITISGFSAGGRDVLAILSSPVFSGKFQQAVSFSGGLTIADPDLSRTLIADKLARFAVEDGIKASTEEASRWLLSEEPEVRGYLYGLPSTRLVTAFGTGGIRMAGFPHLYADGSVLPTDGFKAGVISDVPLVLVRGGDEFSLFAVNDPYFAAARKDNALVGEGKAANELRFAIKYGSLLYGYANVDDVIKNFTAYKNPIYAIDVAWGNNPDIVGKEMAALWGSHHGNFLPLITEKSFYSKSRYPDAFTGSGAKEVGTILTAYLKNFIWHGNPNSIDLPLWEAWGDTPNLLTLDADKDTARVFTVHPDTSYDAILDQLAADNSITAAAKKDLLRQVFNGRWFSKKLDQRFGNKDIWIMK